MAKTWEDCKNEVGFDPYSAKRPRRIFAFSEKDGCRVETDKSIMAREIYRQTCADYTVKVEKLWEQSLRADFPNISNQEFDILLSHLYEHDGDHDDLVDIMISLVDLTIKLKALTRKG